MQLFFRLTRYGELVKNLSKETIEKYYFIEWNMIKGLRNRIVHDYEGINLKSIWFVLKNDLLELKSDLQRIISQEEVERIKYENE